MNLSLPGKISESRVLSFFLIVPSALQEIPRIRIYVINAARRLGEILKISSFEK